MIQIKENIKLADYTTFHIGGPADYFCVVEDFGEIREALDFAKQKNIPVLILGGGSNVLISDEGFRGLVMHVVNPGFEMIEEDDSSVLVIVGSGEVWDNVVKTTVEKGWWGIENLSHIPGLMGGFAVQNVGAYGQEASQVVLSVTALDMSDNSLCTFKNSECNFTYRKSIFNTTEKGKYIILQTVIRLSKTPKPNVSYGDVSGYFQNKNIISPTQEQIREAIIEIRNKKFPFPKEVKGGNAGSFFRGPLLDEDSFAKMKGQIIETFGAEAGNKLQSMESRLKVPQGYKTPFAFILDLCGVKGFQMGGAQVNSSQPSIILNATGQASARDVIELFKKVQKQVYKKLGVHFEIEPELVGFAALDIHDIINVGS
jgi:UDP-N-acetylmuramate dehydrogenase